MRIPRWGACAASMLPWTLETLAIEKEWQRYPYHGSLNAHSLKCTATTSGTEQRVRTGCARCKLAHLATLAASLHAFHICPVARNACRLAARVARYLLVYLTTRAASLYAFHVTPCRTHRRAGCLCGDLMAQRRGRPRREECSAGVRLRLLLKWYRTCCSVILRPHAAEASWAIFATSSVVGTAPLLGFSSSHWQNTLCTSRGR